MFVYVMLGSKCNFQCKYCMQVPLIQEQYCPQEKNIDKIKPILADANNHVFYMWGGEPLLYWDEFRMCVEYIREHNPKAEIITISNGSLLTRDKVDFMNKYKVSLSVSGDGRPTAYTRGRDMFQDPEFLKLFLSIEAPKGISVTLTALNQDIINDVWAYYEEILPPGTDYHMEVSFMSDYGVEDSLKTFDYKRLYKTISTIADGFVDSVRAGNYNSKEYLFFRKPIARLKSVMGIGIGSAYDPRVLDYPRCMPTYGVINVDIEGNIMFCHNSDKRLSHVDNPEWLKESQDKFEPYNVYTKTAKCRNCPYYLYCGASCPLLHGEAREMACKLTKIYTLCFYRALEGVGDIMAEHGGELPDLIAPAKTFLGDKDRVTE